MILNHAKMTHSEINKGTLLAS